LKEKILLLCLFCLIVSIFSRDTGDSDFWQSLDEEERVIFVKGVYTGLAESQKILSEVAIQQKKQDPFWVPPFVFDYSMHRLKEYDTETIEDDYILIAKLLDAFYSNSDNAFINVMDALRILILHQTGEVRRANELLLLKQREVLKGR